MSVVDMVFCSNCGEKLSEDMYFCPKCGVRTQRGAKAGAASPMDEMADAFARMGVEMEKAFSIAAKEIEKAFKTAKQNLVDSHREETITCSACGENIPGESSYCYKCGKKITRS